MSGKALSRIVKLLRDGAIIGLVTLAILASVELGIRWIAPQDVRNDYHEGGSIGMKDARLGWIYRPGAISSVRGPEFEAEYRINDEGLRDETPHPTPKPEGLQRILVLGDSFAFGAGNDYESIWPVLLEQWLQRRGHRVDVVKAGVSAYDTAKEALYLERLFPRYDPDVVLLTFLPNDLFTNRPINEETDGPEGGETDPTVQAKGERPFRLHTVLLAKRLLTGSDRLYTNLYLASPRGDYYSSPPGERLIGQMKLTRKLLDRIRSYCDERSAELVVLSIPQQFQVIARANEYEFDGYDPGLIDDRFRAIAAQDGYGWVASLETLAEAYREGEADLYYRLDGHLTGAGNELVAEVAAEALDGMFGDPEPGTQGPPAPGESP